MDEHTFDALAKRIGTGSRRSFLKKAIGLGGAVAVASLGIDEAEAARRGYSGPAGGPLPNEPVSERFCDGGCCWTCTESAQTWIEFDKLDLVACHWLFSEKACGYCLELTRLPNCRVS